MEMIYRSTDVGVLAERYPAEFAASPTWAEFCEAIKSSHLIKYVWAADGFRSMKLNPANKSGHPLVMPEARTFADLFTEARFLPTNTGKVTKRGNMERCEYPGFTLVSGTRAGSPESASAAPCYHAKPKERYVVAFHDGTVVKGTAGALFHMTYAKPNDKLRETVIEQFGMWEGFGSFEAIRWASGHILIVARGERSIGHSWVAILSPGATARELMPQADLDIIAKDEADDAEAWGSCIYVGDDGRHYLNREACKVRIEER